MIWYDMIYQHCFGAMYLSFLKIEMPKYVTDQKTQIWFSFVRSQFSFISISHTNWVEFEFKCCSKSYQDTIYKTHETSRYKWILKFTSIKILKKKKMFVFLLSWRDHPQRHRAFLWYRQNHVLHFRAHIPHQRGWWAKNGKIHFGETLLNMTLLWTKPTWRLFFFLYSVFQLPGCCGTLQMFRPPSEPESGIHAFRAWTMWVHTLFTVLNVITMHVML